MAVEEENLEKPPAEAQAVSQSSSSQAPRPSRSPVENDAASSPKKPLTPHQFIRSVASKISSQPLKNPDPNVWGVLTAISSNSRKRPQGINIMLTAEEHSIGRLVRDEQFQIDSTTVSARHCKIYRKIVAIKDESSSNSDKSVFLIDTSTNGTYLNWKKLNKNSPEAKVNHGDIISIAAPPHHEAAFAFIFREVARSTVSSDCAAVKRKAEDVDVQNKRLKGIGIGAPDGPISLDDFRSLQRSNKELRKQLESQVIMIDTLHNEHRATTERHVNEIREVKESISKSYTDQLKELQHALDVKQQELLEVNRIYAEQKHSLENLNERLAASKQSNNEANEIMKSLKASVAELEGQLEEERDQRREERQKAAADLKAAVQKVQSEAQEEVKRLSETALQHEREMQEEVNKLQEREKKWCAQVETLRPKLEETRQKLVLSDNKVRQLEAQVFEEQRASAVLKKRGEELDLEVKNLKQELDCEKAAREEAWAKVSTLELAINAATRDLEFERRRLKAARERIMLRETQLRAFYSTTEEISILFAKQQEQLKAMQRTLEDDENYDNTSEDIGLNVTKTGSAVREKEMSGCHSSGAIKIGCATSVDRVDLNQAITSSEEVSATEKHDCDIRSQGEDQNTQEQEFTSADCHAKGAFGSDIDGTATAPFLEGDAIGTEQVNETESPGIGGEQNLDLNKFSSIAGDTMQVDDEAHVHESEERIQTVCDNALRQSQSNNPSENEKTLEDTEPGGTIRTADLLASEVIGSWAYSTAPSVHGDNGSPRSRDDEGGGGGGGDLHDLNIQVAESQSTPSSNAAATRQNNERRALSEMIGIIAPDLKDQFGGNKDDASDAEMETKGSVSNSDTEGCSDTDNQKGEDGKTGSISDEETEGSDHPGENQKHDDSMDEDDEATQEDSLG